jgi:hypothetical protein
MKKKMTEMFPYGADDEAQKKRVQKIWKEYKKEDTKFLALFFASGIAFGALIVLTYLSLHGMISESFDTSPFVGLGTIVICGITWFVGRKKGYW